MYIYLFLRKFVDKQIYKKNVATNRCHSKLIKKCRFNLIQNNLQRLAGDCCFVLYSVYKITIFVIIL